MADKKIIETFYGKHSKYEVVKSSGTVFSSSQYYIYKDGEQHSGGYNDLRKAVEAAKKESGN
jgi:hypothetical protein